MTKAGIAILVPFFDFYSCFVIVITNSSIPIVADKDSITNNHHDVTNDCGDDSTKGDANYRGHKRGRGDELRSGVPRMGITPCLGNHRIRSICKLRGAVQQGAR